MPLQRSDSTKLKLLVSARGRTSNTVVLPKVKLPLLVLLVILLEVELATLDVLVILHSSTSTSHANNLVKGWQVAPTPPSPPCY